MPGVQMFEIDPPYRNERRCTYMVVHEVVSTNHVALGIYHYLETSDDNCAVRSKGKGNSNSLDLSKINVSLT